jgi:hypothetical protein
MRLNLPILERLEGCRNILVVGAGGGQDILVGLPLYYTLKEAGFAVHLANYSFSDPMLAAIADEVTILIADQLVGARGKLRQPILYYPEGYLAAWFRAVHQEEVTVWLFAKTGASPLLESYRRLCSHLQIDAIILCDGGVDSLMRGDEQAAGTLIEDSISLAAVSQLTVPVQLLVCTGFGTEVEEGLGHEHALENIAALTKEGAFLGCCALTPNMEAFQFFEAACRYIWETPEAVLGQKHPRSHISSRIIPAAQGWYGTYSMYAEDITASVYHSPLMALYWFFEARGVMERHLFLKDILQTQTFREAFQIYMSCYKTFPIRPRKAIRHW